MQATPSSVPTSGTFFRGDLVMKKILQLFSWASADSRRAVVSYWQKNVHYVLAGKLPRRLAQNSVVRVTDRAQNDQKCVEEP